MGSVVLLKKGSRKGKDLAAIAMNSHFWIAVSVYVPVAIIKKQLNLSASLYTILQILSITFLEKTPILQVLTNLDPAMQDTEE